VRDRVGGLARAEWRGKLEAARLATTGGENVIIACGRAPDVLPRIIDGKPIGTLFLGAGADSCRAEALDRADREAARPRDPRCRRQDAIEQKGRSLLAAGRVEVEGQFQKGDVLSLRGPMAPSSPRIKQL